MNEYQILGNLKTLLLTQTWSGGSNKVFANVTANTTGSVKAIVDLEDGFKAMLKTGMRLPCCLLATLAGDSDPEYQEEPDLIRWRFGALIGQMIPGGALGEEPMMGANIADTTKSEGQGLAALSVPFYSAVGKLNALEGITIQVRETSIQGGRIVGQNYIAYRVWELEAWGTAT